MLKILDFNTIDVNDHHRRSQKSLRASQRNFVQPKMAKMAAQHLQSRHNRVEDLNREIGCIQVQMGNETRLSLNENYVEHGGAILASSGNEDITYLVSPRSASNRTAAAFSGAWEQAASAGLGQRVYSREYTNEMRFQDQAADNMQ